MSFFGTPFTEDEIEKGNAPLWEQVVTDEKGRRRFHGAFTGGFSAGYFNTVGSKEGWTPKNFVSSRNKRSDKGSTQDVHDFMDEEDITHELTQSIKAKQEYQTLGSTATELANRNKKTGTSLSGVLENLIVPSKDAIGVRLLKRMGWTPSRGISKRKKENKSNEPNKVIKKSYGPTIPIEVLQTMETIPINDDDNNEEEEEEGIQQEVEVFKYKHKEDSYGIGYDPYTNAPEFKGTQNKEKDKNKKETLGPRLHMTDALLGTSNTGDKFGLGAFETTSHSHYDIYGIDDHSQYDIDLSLSSASSTTNSKQTPKIEYKSNNINDVDQLEIDVGKCSDGSIPLRGFKVTNKSIEKPKWYPPPTLPSDFKPQHRVNNNIDINNQTMNTSNSNNNNNNNITNAQQRGMLLGETPLPSKQQQIATTVDPSTVNIFDLIAPEDRERLTMMANNTNKFVTTGTTERREEERITIEQRTEWDQQRKDKEKLFKDTNEKFKPLSTVMANRFTSAGKIETNGLEINKSNNNNNNNNTKNEYKKETYAETAATMKMYGKLTRETEEWYPEGLLCKRFNLKNPHAGKPKPVKKETQSNMLGVLDNQLPIDTPTSFDLQNNNNNNNTNVSQFEQTIEMQTIDNEEDIRDNLDAQLETEKPPIDLFKAIFENEEEEQADKMTAEEDTEVSTIRIDNNSETNLFNNNNDNNHIDNDDKHLKNETIVNSKFEIINLERKMEVDPTVKTIVFDNLSNNNTTSRTTETTATTINVESNPYLYYPPKRDTRGGYITSNTPTTKTAEIENTKKIEYKDREHKEKRKERHSSSDSDSSPERRRKREKKHKRDKKHKKEKSSKKSKKQKKSKKD